MSYKITFIRHALPAKTAAEIIKHSLSEEGKQQAEQLKIKLGKPVFDLIFHSSAPRTRDTAMIVAGLGDSFSMIEIPELFTIRGDPRAELTDRLFRQFGHAPLRKYYLRGGRPDFESLGAEACLAIQANIPLGFAGNILIVGHGIFLQAICIALTHTEEPFIDRILGECQGYQLTIDGDRVTEIGVID